MCGNKHFQMKIPYHTRIKHIIPDTIITTFCYENNIAQLVSYNICLSIKFFLDIIDLSHTILTLQPPGQHPKEISNSNPKEFGNSSVPASIVMPHLQNLFQQTSFQRV